MALTFFLTYESTPNGEDIGADDYSAGDTTGTLANSGTIGAVGKVGTSGFVGAASAASACNFSPASIFPGTTTAPGDALGAMGTWYKWNTAFPAAGNSCMQFRGVTSAHSIGIETHSSQEVRLYIGNATVNTQLLTTVLNAVAGNWYFLLARFDLANDKRAIEVYDSTGTLIEKVEDTTTDLSTFIPADVNVNFQTAVKAATNANTIYADNVFVGNTYAEPIQNNLSITAYSQYSSGLDPIRLVWRK